MKPKPAYRWFFLLILIVGVVAGYGCGRSSSDGGPERIQIGGEDCWLTAKRKPSRRILKQAEELVQEHEQLLVDQGAGSHVVKINSSAGQSPVQVHPKVIGILRKSLNFAQLSDGRYDPSAAPLYDLWRKAAEQQQQPARSLVYSLLDQVNFRRISVNAGMRQVYIPDAGMQITMQPGLNGYVVDRAAELFQQNEIGDIIISKGVVRKAVHGDSRITYPKEVLYADAERHSEPVLTLNNLKTRAIVTLYASEHLFIDLSSGFPAKNGLVALVCIGPDAYASEVLTYTVATGELVSGIALVEEMPFFEVLCITEDQEIICTSGIEPHLRILNSEYTLHVYDSRVEKDIRNERIAYLRPLVSVGTADGENILR